jgi:predicted nucleic acid-binding protein
VDTDVVVAGIRAFRQPPIPSEPIEAALFRKWLRGEWTWVVSEELLDEYREVLLTRGARSVRVNRFVEVVAKHARMVVPRQLRAPLPDPDDAHVIGTARASGTAVLTRNVTDFPPSLVRAISPEDALKEIETYLHHPMVRRRRGRLKSR